MGAVAELVNQTGQGLLRITGVNRLPTNELRLQRRALNKHFSRFSISTTKCILKFIQTNTPATPTAIKNQNNIPHSRVKINAMVEAVYTVDHESVIDSTNEMYNLTGCYLLLSDDILYIIDKNEDMLLRAFYISQIELSINCSSNNDLLKINQEEQTRKSLLIVTLHSNRVEENFLMSDYEKMYMSTIDRLIDYVNLQQQFVKHSKDKKSIESSHVIADTTTNIYQDFHLDDEQLGKFLQKNNQINYSKTDKNANIHDDFLLKIDFNTSNYYQFANIDIFNYLKYYNGLPCICGSFLSSLNLISSHLTKETANTACASVANSDKIINKMNDISINRSIIESSLITSACVDEKIKDKQQQLVYYVDPRVSTNFVNIFNSLKRKLLNKGFQF